MKIFSVQAATSPTKSLIEKYNTGVIRAEERNRFQNDLGRRSNTKKLINKWNNPEKLHKAPPSGGFQVLIEISQQGRDLQVTSKLFHEEYY